MERSDSTTDEEEDRRNLIDGTESKPVPSACPAPLHVDDNSFGSTLRRRRFSLLNFNFSKRYYLLALSLPLFILLVYFFSGIRDIFSSNICIESKNFDSPSDRMRESELEALYLLRQQRLGLLTLWNHSLAVHSNPSPNSIPNNNLNSSSILIEDLNAGVMKQISLNREIQQVLLSSHRVGNLSNEVGDGSILNGFGLDRCRKVDQKWSDRRTIEWKPKSDKYLFAVCVSGQTSNHLICLEKHMFFAALLDRVLVIPSPRVDYQYSRVLDIDHINKCLGRKVVISFEEFANVKKKHLHIDRFLCYFSKPNPCFLDEEHFKKLKNLGISLGKVELPWDEDTRKPSQRTVQHFQSKFSTDDDVLAIGDVFYANVEQEWVMQPGGPLAHQCKTLIEPSRLIWLTAQRFIQTFLGNRFIALHFRRHGFLKFCNDKQPSCFFPIPQAAECIMRVVERAEAPVIYLSTDAAESETGLLQSLLVLNGKPIPLVKRPPRNSAEKWDALLYRHHIEGDPQVEAMLDKAICAMSSVFIGASGSTFTQDILRLRKDWRSASMCDEYLCRGENPNFIAESE